MNQKSTLEEDYFSPLQKNFKGKPGLQLEMIRIFLDQVPDAIETMENSLNEEGLSKFTFEAHRIKSTIRIIGLPKLQPIITQLDDYCYRKINLEQIPTLFAQFKAQALYDIQKVKEEQQRLSSLN